MPRSALPHPPREWIKTGEARRILELSQTGFDSLVAKVPVTCRRFPSGRRVYLRADIEKLAASLTGSSVEGRR